MRAIMSGSIRLVVFCFCFRVIECVSMAFTGKQIGQRLPIDQHVSYMAQRPMKLT